MAAGDDKLMTMAEVKAVTDTKVNADLASLMDIGVAPSVKIDSDNWADIYTVLSDIAIGTTSTVYISSTGNLASLITGGNLSSGAFKGIVCRASAGIYDFFVANAIGNELAKWRITDLTTETSTPTILYFEKYFSDSALTIRSTATTLADFFEEISNVPAYKSAFIYITGTGMTSLLSNGKISGMLQGHLTRANASGTIEFDLRSINGAISYYWRISNFTSARATPSIGTIYRTVATAVT